MSVTTSIQHQPASPPDINSTALGELLHAARNDVPSFSDRPEIQAVVDSVWRSAIDRCGSCVLKLRDGAEVMP